MRLGLRFTPGSTSMGASDAAVPRSFNAHYDHDPAAYDVLRAGWMSMRRVEEFRAFLSSASAGTTVCEIGSGTGAALLNLARARPDLRFIGVEPIRGYVDYAVTRVQEANVTNVEFFEGTVEDLARIGVVNVGRWVSSDVLHHVRDEGAAVAAVAAASSPGAQWLLIEPNLFNVYVALYQGLTDGERNFRAGRFSNVSEVQGWRRESRRYMFLIPARIAEPSALLRRLEHRLERWRLAGGAVVMTLRLTS